MRVGDFICKNDVGESEKYYTMVVSYLHDGQKSVLCLVKKPLVLKQVIIGKSVKTHD